MPIPNPKYQYQPVYGVDPWKKVGPMYSDQGGLVPVPDGPFGGGAEITGQNLLISLWLVSTTQTVDGILVPDTGVLLIPYAEFGDIDPPPEPPTKNVDVVPARRQEFLSRTSARFALDLDALGPAPTPPPRSLLAVLNPPGSLKDRLAFATKYTRQNGGISGAAVKPLVDCFLWDLYEIECFPFKSPGSFAATYKPGQADAFVGGAGEDRGAIPLLKTSGANGVFPTFFNGSVAGILEEQDARNAGDFYVPLWIDYLLPDTPQGSVITISYPHSTARV